MDCRYPYTLADDYVRAIAGHNSEGTKLSRADASKIICKIAEVLGMESVDLFNKLADAQQAKTPEDFDREAREALEAVRYRTEPRHLYSMR